jgi:hypothetical protein
MMTMNASVVIVTMAAGEPVNVSAIAMTNRKISLIFFYLLRVLGGGLFRGIMRLTHLNHLKTSAGWPEVFAETSGLCYILKIISLIGSKTALIHFLTPFFYKRVRFYCNKKGQTTKGYIRGTRHVVRGTRRVLPPLIVWPT